MKDVYKINEEKIKLLVLGVDDSIVDYKNRNIISKNIRKSLNINKDDFVIITGGKIDLRKNIINLMLAVEKINKDKIKLIVFGSLNKETENDVKKLSKNKNIRYIKWIEYNEIYKYFFASDLAFFPGTHSVLWEQAVGLGLPCVFKKWKGIKHIDLGGNCLFINSGRVSEIIGIIENIFKNNSLLLDLKKNANEKGISYFSYYKIAKRAIE